MLWVKSPKEERALMLKDLKGNKCVAETAEKWMEGQARSRQDKIL